MRILKSLLLALLALAGASAAHAEEPTAPYRERAGQIVALLNGELPPERLFSAAFLAQVPAAQVKEIAVQLTRAHGRATAIKSIDAKTATSGTVTVDLERATVAMNMAIAPSPPHLVEGLLVTAVEAKGETVRDVFGALAALHGEVTIAAARLGDGPPQAFLTDRADKPMAVGSAFKLFILAELAREVKSGERRWTDVVALDRRSLPSGFLQTWPERSPMTLHSLAALMISQSDNSAADTLLALVGREKVERLLPTLGVAAPERLRPFLSTREAFALKGGPAALRTRWAAADEAGRRALLAGDVSRVDLATLDLAAFAGRPAAIAEVEWFASAGDLVRTIDWLRRNGDRTILDLLAINPGLPALKRDYDYVGFKGGSEAGVMNLTYLLRRKDGVWLAAAISWNDPAAALDESRFAALVGRLLALLARD